jgi:sec-independent protein translocase protein TatB
MFEVGFTEIILILGIALVVLGPEKLPKVAADIGRWVGRARAMARQFKSQLDEEVVKADRDWSRPAASSSTPPKKSPVQDIDASPNRAAPPPAAATPSAQGEPASAGGNAPAPAPPADAAPGADPPAAPAVDPGEPGHAKP